MDRTEIIERLKNIAEHAVHTVGERPFIMSLDDGIAVHEAIELLKKAETNCPEIPDSWIPVTERLPEIGELVLVCCMYGDGYMDQTIDSRAKDGNWWSNIAFNDPDPAECCKVIAWMPLPDPWKGE